MKYRKEHKKINVYKVVLTVLAAVIAVELVVIVFTLIGSDNSSKKKPVLPNSSTEKQTAIPVEVTASPDVTSTPEVSPTPEATPTPAPIVRRGTKQVIPQDVRQVMAGKSMPSGASVGYDDLSYLTIPYYNFNYEISTGHMIVSNTVADEVLDIFAELFDIKYPIEKMEIIDYYGADDYASIDDNNTSAFNYRLSTDGSGRLSNHARGLAIDINPKINPYVKSNGTGSHSNAKEYWSRDYTKWTNAVDRAAYIGPENKIYDIFMNEHSGWEWGGSWSSYRDYQHFQKKR